MNRPARPPRRPVHGVLLLDKPIGLSSNDALMRAKRLFNAQKAGHTGTLDPLASGLLPVCFGEATKFSQDLLDAPKQYEARVALGATTTTGDAEGDVMETRAVTVTTADVVAVLPGFTGDLLQVPPMYSALKRDGRPLYEYARAGITLVREPRAITIHRLDLIDSALPAAADITLRVGCSKGTYIRTLAQDIGAALGCGAHLAALRRTGVGVLTLTDAVTLAQLEALDEPARAALLRPVDSLLVSFPAAHLTAEAAGRFKHGQRLKADATALAPPMTASVRDAASPGAASPGAVSPGAEDAVLATARASSRVRVYDEAGRFLGTAHCVDGVIAPERLVASD